MSETEFPNPARWHAAVALRGALVPSMGRELQDVLPNLPWSDWEHFASVALHAAVKAVKAQGRATAPEPGGSDDV